MLDPEDVQEAALEAWHRGNLNKEFVTKQQMRRIDDAFVQQVLASNMSLIGRYVDHGQPRYGFWHPGTRVFVAWQPPEAGFVSELKTCFVTVDGESYIRNRREFAPVKGFS